MSYKYFTERLVNQEVLDLTSVFPEKIVQVNQAMNTSYYLPDVVLFLMQRSNNFKVADQMNKDLDYAMKEVISRYYKSIGETNPFVSKDDEDEELETYQKGVQRRDAVEVVEGKVKPTEKKSKAQPVPEEPKESKEPAKPARKFGVDDYKKAIRALKNLPQTPPVVAAIKGMEVMVKLESK